MKASKRKVKDGKVHKKARVARFITNNFYYWYANKAMDMPNGTLQPTRQPINHRSNISKQQNQNHNNKELDHTHTMNNSQSQSKLNSVLNDEMNKDQDTNSINDNALEIDTINKPFPACVVQIYPKSFDIIKRGPLPSILLQNNKVKIIES